VHNASWEAPYLQRESIGLRQNTGRKIVTLLSVVIGIIGFVFMVIYRIEQVRRPLWIDVAVAYGAVFWLIYLLDRASLQFARFRHESPTELRPRPVSLGSSMPLASTPQSFAAHEIRLQRISVTDVETLQVLVDDAVRELAALTDTVPEVDALGHVVDWNLQSRLQDPDLHGFFFQVGVETLGFAFLQGAWDEFTLQLFYIAQDVRRRGIGRSAIDKICEFTELLGNVHVIKVTVPSVNRRAQKFLHACGFTAENEAETWVRKVGKS
jgi:GNAT superfamily N-acetyltransferase